MLYVPKTGPFTITKQRKERNKTNCNEIQKQMEENHYANKCKDYHNLKCEHF